MLKEFGQALAHERTASAYSLANLAKSMGGVSKEDIRAWEDGQRAPGKLELTQLLACFPKLRRFESQLRTCWERGPIREKRKPAPRHEPDSRLPIPRAPRRAEPEPEIIVSKPRPPEMLTAKPFANVLKVNSADKMTELAAMVTQRFKGPDYVVTNDGQTLIVRHMVKEGKDPEPVFSGCYLTLTKRVATRITLKVFLRTHTAGDFETFAPRNAAICTLHEVAKMLHEHVRGLEFER